MIAQATYRVCPRCSRAVPAQSDEHYCINDGNKLLEVCPSCQAKITSPQARYCSVCGFHYADVLKLQVNAQ